MRLWSISPKYLDSIGLIANWREGLLALNVLQGKTKGYKNHPQLDRFKSFPNPALVLSNYLWGIVEEANVRGYNFDTSKLMPKNDEEYYILVNFGQIKYEFDFLMKKIMDRKNKSEHDKLSKWSYNMAMYYNSNETIETHPMIITIFGIDKCENWEKLPLDS